MRVNRRGDERVMEGRVLYTSPEDAYGVDSPKLPKEGKATRLGGIIPNRDMSVFDHLLTPLLKSQRKSGRTGDISRSSKPQGQVITTIHVRTRVNRQGLDIWGNRGCGSYWERGETEIRIKL